MKNIGADMRQVRESLAELDAGPYTQFLEKEIVADIGRLIQALEEELQQKPPQQGPSGAGENQPPGQPRLVPTARELILLRDLQTRVNRGTRDLEDLRVASEDGVSESWERALNRLYQKQGNVSDMTKKILEDFQKAAAQGHEDPNGAGGAADEDEAGETSVEGVERKIR